MVQYAKILSFLLAALAVVEAAYAQGLLPQRDNHRCEILYCEVSFRLYRDYLIVVPGSLAGLPGKNLLIDTGSTPSVVNNRLAQVLHLGGKPETLGLLNRTISVRRSVLKDLQIGSVHIESVPVLIRNLDFLQAALGVRVDAIVGLDVLKLNNFTIDYKRRKIVFGPISSGDRAVPFDGAPPFITVVIEVKHVTLRLLLDTGASGLILFRSRIHGRLSALQELRETRSSNMGGEFRLQEVLLPHLYIGGVDLGSHNAFLADDQPDVSRTFDGLMGFPALGMTKIAFDFQQKTFAWKR